MIDYLVALALLVGEGDPPDCPAPGVVVAFDALVRLHELDDTSYAWWHFPSRVMDARQRAQALRHAPLVADLDRLPPREMCEQWRRESLRARDLIRARASVDAARREALELALYEDTDRHDALEAMAEATRDGLGTASRRAALLRLRDRIGPAAYARGNWPAPIPFHLLPQVP